MPVYASRAKRSRPLEVAMATVIELAEYEPRVMVGIQEPGGHGALSAELTVLTVPFQLAQQRYG